MRSIQNIFFLILALDCGAVSAQPNDRITLISPFPPGGPVDTLARILAEGLQKRTGSTVVVENITGAAGNLGMDRVKHAKPDGKTLLVVPEGNLTINPTLMAKFPFEIDKDFSPITMLAKAPNVLLASAGSDIKSLHALIVKAQAQPGTLAYASPGIGSGLHLAGELLKQQANIDLLHVPYKGTAPALNDVLGGAVPLMFSNLPAALPHIRAGKLIALGVSDFNRAEVAPQVPTLSEQGVTGVNVTSWYALLAPANTPSATIDTLWRDVTEILNQPAVRGQLKAQGLSEWIMKPADFAAHIRNETATWARIIKARNIVAE